MTNYVRGNALRGEPKFKYLKGRTMKFRDTTTSLMKKYSIVTYTVSDGETSFNESIIVLKNEAKMYQDNLKEKYGDDLISFDIHPMERYELK